MSSRRHGAPLIAYSESPLRNSVRVIVTSENSIGSRFAVLSIVSETSARPSAGRSGVPAKMTSSILPPRSVRGPWAPSTHATASTRFDFPEPFGPTTTMTPGSNSSTVLSANDLNPRRVNAFRNTPQLLLGLPASVGGHPARSADQRSGDPTACPSGTLRPGRPRRRRCCDRPSSRARSGCRHRRHAAPSRAYTLWCSW